MFSPNLRSLPDLGRFGNATLLKRQCVAEHTFFVSIYASQICKLMALRAEITLEVLEFALRHDFDERWSTDIPGPAKRDIVDPVKMAAHKARALRVYGDPICDMMADGVYAGDLAKDIVKCADLIDEVFYLQREYLMGNRLVKQYIANSQNRLEEACKNLGLHSLFQEIMARLAEWETEGTGVITNDSDVVRLSEDEDIPF